MSRLSEGRGREKEGIRRSNEPCEDQMMSRILGSPVTEAHNFLDSNGVWSFTGRTSFGIGSIEDRSKRRFLLCDKGKCMSYPMPRIDSRVQPSNSPIRPLASSKPVSASSRRMWLRCAPLGYASLSSIPRTSRLQGCTRGWRPLSGIENGQAKTEGCRISDVENCEKLRLDVPLPYIR